MTTTHPAPTAAHEKPLNPLSIAAGFAPWIAFTVIAQRTAADGVAWAALIAGVMTAVALAWSRGRHSPTQLTLFSGVLFALVAVLGFAGGAAVDRWLFEWGRPLVGVALGLAVLVTCRVRPFTAEYAKRSTPPQLWTSPTFVRVNRVLSATWGVALVVTGLGAVLVTALDANATGTGDPHLLDLLLHWVLPIAVITWTVRFTNAYPARVVGGAR
jgi:hypothetical protein